MFTLSFKMSIKELISYEFPILTLQDTGQRALSLMNEFRVFHLPLVDRGDYMALISEDDLLDWDTPEEPLSLAEFINFRPMVSEQMHPYEAMKLVKEFNLSIIPVVGLHQHFVGIVTVEGLFNYLLETNAVKEMGAIIVLEMEQRNYSASEIARICESNNISILSLFVNTLNETGIQIVTLKVNQSDVQALIATFERYGYVVKDVYAAKNHLEDLQQNYDAFMNYLNV